MKKLDIWTVDSRFIIFLKGIWIQDGLKILALCVRPTGFSLLVIHDYWLHIFDWFSLTFKIELELACGGGRGGDWGVKIQYFLLW